MHVQVFFLCLALGVWRQTNKLAVFSKGKHTMTFVTTRGCLFQWRHVMFKLMLSDYNATRWTTCYHRYHCAQWITQYKINPFIVFNSIAMSIAYKWFQFRMYLVFLLFLIEYQPINVNQTILVLKLNIQSYYVPLYVHFTLREFLFHFTQITFTSHNSILTNK